MARLCMHRFESRSRLRILRFCPRHPRDRRLQGQTLRRSQGMDSRSFTVPSSCSAHLSRVVPAYLCGDINPFWYALLTYLPRQAACFPMEGDPTHAVLLTIAQPVAYENLQAYS